MVPSLSMDQIGISNPRNSKHDLWAAFGYLGLSCLYAWRVLAHFGSHLAGHGGDGWQNLWNMWWFKQALAQGSNPYYTDMLHQPHGTSLLFQTLNPFNCALALPLDAVFGQPAAYNLVFLFSFAASGFTMYLLVRELSGNRPAAFLAGCVFTFSHFHFAHAQGHMQLTAMEWLPLFVYYLVRVWRTHRLRDGLLMGGALALTTFCSIYYFVAGFLVAILAVGWVAVRKPRQLLSRSLILSVLAGAGLFMATGGILLISMWVAQTGQTLLQAHDARYWSTDLQAFFIPPWVSIYGSTFSDYWRSWTGNSAECNQYLGYSVILLGLFSFLWSPKGRRPWPWLVLLLLGIFLSLGPFLHWGGVIHDDIPLPFRWLEVIFPFLVLSGAPVRWHIVTLLASSVLAGLGLTQILERVGAKTWKGFRLAPAIAAAATAVVLIELAPHWIESRPLRQPGFIEKLQATPADWRIYDLGDANKALLRQIGHEHKMIGGYISRTSQKADQFLRSHPLLRALRGEGTITDEQLGRLARELKLKFLILPSRHRATTKLATLGLSRRWRERGLEVWEIPWQGEAP